MPRIRSIRKRGETKNFLFPFSSPSFLFALSFSLARLCPILEHLQACTPLRRVGRETKRGSCITRSNLTQVEATRLGVYAEDRSKHLHFPCACFSLFFFFFSANQLNHRPFLSFYRARARARFGFTFLVIMHYYPPGRIYRNSAFNATTTTTTRPPLPGKRLNASRVR